MVVIKLDSEMFIFSFDRSHNGSMWPFSFDVAEKKHDKLYDIPFEMKILKLKNWRFKNGKQ